MTSKPSSDTHTRNEIITFTRSHKKLGDYQIKTTLSNNNIRWAYNHHVRHKPFPENRDWQYIGNNFNKFG